MIRISDQVKDLCVGPSGALRVTFLCLTLLLNSPLFAADPPPLTDAARSTTAPAGVNAQQLCAAPVLAFQERLAEAMLERVVTPGHQQSFLKQVQSCRRVYQLEVERLEADFAALPNSSVCHAALRELPEGLDVFNAIEKRARALRLDSQENRDAAGAFFRLTSPGLVRAVNGLYLLRHGVCMEEVYAPFATVLTDPEISRALIYLE
ncbi:hypothetical protein [Halopseudomonas pelagia]|uniref:hypothetical protein n=1 Tax=Halopseudomonas pelagia TaxID=553151 RepID=UPI0012689E41|nr:hypothetical protein [Halopseudomonas pelagia]